MALPVIKSPIPDRVNTQGESGAFDASVHFELAGSTEYELVWNGAAQASGDIPTWALTAHGAQITVEATSDDITLQIYLFGAMGAHCRLRQQASGTWRLHYNRDSDQASVTLNGPTVVQGTKYTFIIDFRADGVNMNVNGTDFFDSNVPSLTTIVVERIGSNWDGTAGFRGVAKKFIFNDVADSRNYPIDDGPATSIFRDLGAGSQDATQINVVDGNWQVVP